MLKDLGKRAGVCFDLGDKLLDDFGPVTLTAEDQEVGRIATGIVRPRRFRLDLAEDRLVRLERLDPLDEFKVNREESYVGVHTDRRLFIADARIASARLAYHTTERMELKDINNPNRLNRN